MTLSNSATRQIAPLVIISPVRDEIRFVRLTLEAMIAQTVRPQEWLFVDDGSTDGTGEVLREYAKQHAWIRVVQRADRGFRQLGSGVIAAFEEGRAQLADNSYRYIAKLDGDMSFPPRYLEVMLARLEAEADLAAVSGKVFRPEAGGEVEEFIIDDMVAGQFKLYKRACFEAIGGFTQTILWDGIDIHRCRMKGFRTLSFHHPDARLTHHRLMGSSDKNVYKGRVRLGRGIWFMGYHPLYALASSVFRMGERPKFSGGLLMMTAYCYAALRGEPRFDDPTFIKNLQSWQLTQLKLRFQRQLSSAAQPANSER